jgi:hypothetical protein
MELLMGLKSNSNPRNTSEKSGVVVCRVFGSLFAKGNSLRRAITPGFLCGVLFALCAVAYLAAPARADDSSQPGSGAAASNLSFSMDDSASLNPDLVASLNPTSDDAWKQSAAELLANDPLNLDDIEPSSEPATKEAPDYSLYPDRWWGTIPLTLWLPSVQGHIGVNTPAFSHSLPVDSSFDQLAKYLQGALILPIEIGHGPVFGGFQAMWLSLGDSGITGPAGVADVNLRANETLLNLYFGYHFLDLPLSENGEDRPSLSLDGLIGSYWTYLHAKVSPANLSSISTSVNWFDPYVGLRGELDFTDHIGIRSTGEIGGFDADHDNLFWFANALVQYRFTPMWSIFAGYQAMSQDYENTFVWKMTTAGPILGFSFRW